MGTGGLESDGGGPAAVGRDRVPRCAGVVVALPNFFYRMRARRVVEHCTMKSREMFFFIISTN